MRGQEESKICYFRFLSSSETSKRANTLENINRSPPRGDSCKRQRLPFVFKGLEYLFLENHLIYKYNSNSELPVL